jgi:hypothetical protein
MKTTLFHGFAPLCAAALSLSLAPSAFAEAPAVEIEVQGGDAEVKTPDIPEESMQGELRAGDAGVEAQAGAGAEVEVPEVEVQAGGAEAGASAGATAPEQPGDVTVNIEQDEIEVQSGALDDELTEQKPKAEIEKRDELLTNIGIGVTVGGGAQGFTEGVLADITDPGPAWTARLTVGTRQIVAVEAAYIGSVNSIDAAGLADTSQLFSNGAEGVLRINLTQSDVQPYIFGGAAWRRYELLDEGANTSVVRNNDDVLETPFGAGLALHFSNLLADFRGEYRPVFDDNLIRDVAGVTDGRDTGLENWTATGRIGFEF